MISQESTIKKGGLLFLMLTIFFVAEGQTIRLNEVAPTNVSYLDEDGDTPDWFELYNYGTESISLNGWSISDKASDSLKWQFPDISLGPDQYLLLWASGKDRKFIGYPRTLVNPFTMASYLIPNSSLPTNWTEPGFNDTDWQTGKTGIGYGDGDDSTVVATGTGAIFLRIEFELTDVSAITELIFDVDYDDSFVAYLNGQEIARAGISGTPPSWDQFASLGHEANLHRGLPLDRFVIANPQDILISGTNVLSVQAHNISGTSSDLSILPVLSALYTTTPIDGDLPADFLNLRDQYLHTNFKISSSGETIYLYNQDTLFVDSLASPEINGEISVGRLAEAEDLYFFDEPTPGLPNSTESYLGQLDHTVMYSNDGGMVSGSLNLLLSGNEVDEEIYYTLNGTLPTEASSLYTDPIPITSTTIVKASILKDGYLPSEVATRSYIFGGGHAVPVVSLTFDHDDFFDPVDGMYVLGEGYSGDVPYFGSNIWEEWERPVTFSFYDEAGILGISQDMGAKIFGGWSRANAQRSMSLFARSSYGKNALDYPLFNELDYSSFQAIVLRNSGNDWQNTQFRDAMTTSLMQGSGLEYPAFRPVVTYFNGEYWGFYNIREKINEHFLAAKAGVDPDDIDLLEFNGDVVQGSNVEYLNLLEYIGSHSLTNQENYQYVKSEIDIDNYMSYLAVQIYSGNTDWPGNNIKFWNHPEGKWRWILYDTDFGFSPWDNNGYYHNTLEFALEANGPGWPNPPWSTFLFRKMVENEEFRHALINRFADFLNTRFKENHVVDHIDSISALIQPEMAQHMDRWGGNYYGWPSRVERMRNFGQNRPSILRQHIREQFGLTTNVRVQTENLHPSRGIIQLNSIIIEDSYWSGFYFSDVPITVRAFARDGYRFTHWSGAVDSTDHEITLVLQQNVILKANFEPIPGEQQPIVINEINYNSDSERPTGDWIELYNPNPYPVNVSNWLFKDDNDLHIFRMPELQDITANGYLVICRDLAAFEEQYSSIENVIGSFDFGLGSEGDRVRIYNADSELQDEVSYSTMAPWPETANGTGATLELLSPDLDNGLPESWASVNAFGSPGRANTLPTAIIESTLVPTLDIYPNPIQEVLNISANETVPGRLYLQIIDLRGVVKLEKEISTLPNSLRLDNLAKGTYILKLSGANGFLQSHKIIRQ